MEALPVEKFFGVGKVTAQKMKGIGLHTGADLKALTEDDLVRHFGKSGRFYYRIVRGIDDRPVRPHRETKSIGAEDTFPYDLTQIGEMNQELDRLAIKVEDRLRRNALKGRTITLKIKYGDFKQITRAQSFTDAVDNAQTIANVAKDLLSTVPPYNKGIRLLGISASAFSPIANKQIIEAQLRLFSE